MRSGLPTALVGVGLTVLLVGAGACQSGRERADSHAATVGTASSGGGQSGAVLRDGSDATSGLPIITVLGDSLTAGLGLAIDEAYPSVLQRLLDADGLHYQVRNAGISGDTSAGGLSRLDWALAGNVRILVVALGANDGLRGLPPVELKKNLSLIIERAQAMGVSVILAGMEAPPNWGAFYTKEFHEVYPSLAEQYHVPLVPFLLVNVAGIAALNQQDGIHPTAQGDQIVAATVWKVLKPVAAKLASRDQGSPGS